MRLRLLPLPLALLVPLAAAAPAMALDWTVDVTSNSTFEPRQRTIQRGDKVIWTFSGSGHSTTSRGGQAESWDSKIRASGRFEHVFDTPGRYQYFCKPHEGFMFGTITVGSDAVANTLKAVKTKRSGNRVTVTFTLNEPATVKYILRGATRRTVKRGRLRKGDRSLTVKGLNEGSHAGTLVAEDDFDKRDSAKKSFVIR
jgi:plastocyanin